jgi:hypothetical protein
MGIGRSSNHGIWRSVAACNVSVSGLDWDVSVFTPESDHESAELR